MGGIARTLFGGSKSKSTSDNQFAGSINSALTPAMTTGTNAMATLSNVLGLNGGPAQTEAFDNFMNNSAFKSLMDESMRGITGSQAAGGMLSSGATLKAMQNRGQDLVRQKIGDYLSQVGNLATQGLNAAGIITNAGQRSKSKSTSSNGIVNSLFG